MIVIGIVIGIEGVVNVLAKVWWSRWDMYSADIVRMGWVRIRFEHFLKAMCLGDQNHNYIANIETGHYYVIIIIILKTINTYNYDYIYKAVDRRRGPEDEPVRRESRRVGGKRPGDHPVIQEEAAGEEIRR